MRGDGFEIILLVIFISKLLWNVIFPAIMEWQWNYRRSNKRPRSFNMFIGFEALSLIFLSLWIGYKANSYIYGLAVAFLGVFFIAISYALSIAITRFIRNKS